MLRSESRLIGHLEVGVEHGSPLLKATHVVSAFLHLFKYRLKLIMRTEGGPRNPATTAFVDQPTSDRHAAGWEHYLPWLAVAASGGEPGADDWHNGPPPPGGARPQRATS